MADIAQLGIEIDTRKLKSGEKDLAAFSNSAKTATSAIAAFIGAASVSQLIKIADGYAQMEAKVSRYTKSQVEANATLQQLISYANKSGSAVSDAVNVFNSLTASLESVGASKSQILSVTEEINKLGVIGGSSVEDMRFSMRQFGQAMAGGVVRAEEFNSIIENTPEIARSIAAGMGVSMGQLRQDMLAGKLTSDAVFKALLSQVSSTNDAFDKMPRTVSQAMGQMANNFQVVVGELNKTTGATAALSSGLDSFSNSMLTASNYTDEIVTGVELLALAYGSKLAASLGGVISQKVADIAATNTQIATTAKEAEAAALAAGMETRRAEANVLSAESALASAAANVALAQATTILGTSEMASAKAQVTSAQTTLALFEAERALEAQRMAAQISDKGRIATATRMAQVEQAAAVAKGNVAKAELAYAEAVKLATAQETAAKQALTVAESQLRAAKLAKTEATAIETAAQKSATVAAEAATVANRALNGAMALLGGPAGVIMLAVGALYMWTSATDEARQKAIDYADGVDTATASLRNMTSAQLSASQVKLGQSIDAQARSASELRAEVEELQDTVNKQIAVSKMLGNATAANTYEMDQLKLKSAELEAAESKLSQMRSKSYAITQTLNGNLKENYVAMQNSNSVTGIANGIQSVFNGVLSTGNKLLQQRNNYVLLGNGAKSNLTATDQKYLTQLENEIALEKELDPIKRARIKAEQEAAAQGLSASGTIQYINQSVKLAEIQAKNDAASKSLTASYKSESAATANATKQINSEIVALEFRVATIGKTEAQIALYKLATEGATKAQLEHTKTLLDQLSAYDAQIKKQQDAISAADRYNQMMRQYDELITGAKSGTTEYGQTLYDLNVLLSEGKINQQEYNAAVGRLNTKYAEAGQSAVDWAKIQEDAINAGKDALAEFLYDPLEGGFSGMVDSFTVALRQMAAQAAAANIMQSLFGATGTGQVSGGGGWTETLASTVGSMFSFDGGGYTGDGSRTGGLDGKGGFWAMMHPQETVIDHTKSGVDNSRTVNTSSESNSNTRNTVINLSQTITTTGKIDNRTSKQIATDTYRKQRLVSGRLGA